MLASNFETDLKITLKHFRAMLNGLLLKYLYSPQKISQYGNYKRVVAKANFLLLGTKLLKDETYGKNLYNISSFDFSQTKN